MLGRAAVVTATAVATLAIGAGTAGAATPIVPSSAADVDYHAEGQIAGGNIHIETDRAPAGGVALADCDPDPRPAPHARPDACAFTEPAGAGDDLVSFGGHIADADVSPDGAFTPLGTPSREHFDGEAGFDAGGPIFAGDFYVDDDMRARLAPRTLDAYLAPGGNANNRWRRFCGTGILKELGKAGHGDGGHGGGSYGKAGHGGGGYIRSGGAHAHDAPFAAGQVRKFVVEVWDADFRAPSDKDGGNQDYWVIDILKPGSMLDVSKCQSAPPPVDVPPTPVTPVTPGPAAPPPLSPDVAAQPPSDVAAHAPTATSGSQAPLVLGSSARAEVRVSGASTRGPGGCVRRAFNVAVAGTNIRYVDFSLDGRFLRRVTRRDTSGFYRATISLRGLARTTHRVSARVVFQAGSRPLTRTLPVGFRLCPRAVSRPAFTG
jgi:hypothetical protein